MIISKRSQKGQALTIPSILLAVMVVGLIGIFSFEIARSATARDQLRTATESAALAGAAALASFPQDDPAAWHGQAIRSARSVFSRNDIFGELMTNASLGSGTPLANQTLLEFQFIDPTTKSVVSQGDPKGKVLQVTARHGYTPLFAAVTGTGIPTLPIAAQASGGLGELDVVLCFDCSGSMEFETNITRVRRTWNNATGKIDYLVQGVGKETSFGMRPQQLSGGFNGALRGPADSATPPGNFPPGAASDSGFTDAVVNIDENPNFGGLSEGGFDFPNVATLVEASRGNLDSVAAFNASQANTTLGGVVTPRAGYQAKYFELARKHTHPFAEAEEAGKNFYKLMNRNTRAHFGFVAFNARVGETNTTSFNQPNVSPTYAPAGNGDFPLPGITLSSDPDTSNFNECNTAVGQVVPDGNTNIGGSVERAVRMFDAGARPNARKAIVLFTDGEPTVGGPLSGNPFSNCQQAAALAKSKGIAVYTVGLALDPSLVPIQRQVLGDNVPTGMAFIAGNESKFFQVTSASQLNSAFTSIARHLTQLVQ
ncbi:MAG: VWA domain-containing protein [Candidatus Obscuribacterales bacterium]|nr:VWA domain-containing protein [Candidatus Obscuribacterales bacterium]